jgi:hypothetical protein
MTSAMVDAVVRAVLYEGYLLYPYRPSAVKNRQRFNFGVVYPREYSESQQGADAWTMQTECLLEGDGQARCTVTVRFLRMVTRTIETEPAPAAGGRPEAKTEPVERLEVDGRIFQPWQEAVEEVIEVTEFSPSALVAQRMQWPFRLAAKQEKEAIIDQAGRTAGTIRREKFGIAGMIELATEELVENLWKLTVRISNTSRGPQIPPVSRESALARALVSAHTVLALRGGNFISLADPPEACRNFTSSCQNLGTWPVLVGAPGQRDTMLSSPIILYDYPEIAPESPGDLFDGAEIDEILSLRIMTLTDEEKLEMRHCDDRARKILERTEALPDEQWRKLHGALRGLRTVKGERP